MQAFGWVAIVLAAVSVVFSVLVVGSSEPALQQARRLDFPLSDLGSGAIAMVLPIVFATAALVVALFALRRRIGRWAVVAAVVSWIVLGAVLGPAGFGFLLRGGTLP